MFHVHTSWADMALLTEGQESKLPSLCGIHTSESYKSHFKSHPLPRVPRGLV